MSNYPLASSTWDEKEINAINKVINSNMYTMGDSVAEFERNFADYLGSKYCLMVNSGSSANLLAVGAMFYTKNPLLKKGDEVIVPAVSWSTTYFPLYQYGLKLKFVDIDLNTLNYDLSQLKSAVSEKTKMILAVNLLGNPNDFDEILDIVEKNNLLLMEDNCESLGAEYKGKKAGTFGLLGTFSTFFSHHIATMEGGMIATDDEELYHILLALRSHGWTRHLPKKNKVANKSDVWFEESFRFVLPGYNLRPVEMSGAIGIEQLKKLPEFIKTRRNNAELFIQLFNDNENLYVQKEISESSWFGFSLIVKPHSKFSRADIIKILEGNKIEYRPIVTGDFTKNEVLKYFDYEIHGDLKNSKYLDQNGLFVGNHQINLEKEIKLLHEVLS